MEVKELECMIEALILKVSLQELCIGFVDDTDFYSMREDVQMKMQEILNQYA
jgi:hypothetical protein